MPVCRLRTLPRTKWSEAAANAVSVNPANQPDGMEELPNADDEDGYKLAVDVTRYWGKNGVKLTVGFLDNPPADLCARILEHLNAWNKDARVEFVASKVDPQVRIARLTDRESNGQGGYWSYLGTDILLAKVDEPTMNFEGFTMSTPEREFHRVVRHEGGHTLGFPHEHMRKELIARLDRKKVISAYMKSQGWSEQEVINQLLTPLEESSILGTPGSDQTSIMCYQVPGELTKDGEPILGGLDINDLDYAFAAGVYPKTQA